MLTQPSIVTGHLDISYCEPLQVEIMMALEEKFEIQLSEEGEFTSGFLKSLFPEAACWYRVLAGTLC